MTRHSIIVALIGLACCLHVECAYQMISDLEAMKLAVTNAFKTQMNADIAEADATLQTINPLITACGDKIDTKQTACVACINTTCQARIDSLACNAVVPQQTAGCNLGKALCDTAKFVVNTKNAVQKAAKAVADFANKLGNLIKEEAEKAIETVVKTVVVATNAVKNTAVNVANKVKNAAEGAVKTVGQVVTSAGKAVVEGLNTAVKETGKVLKKIGDVVTDIFSGRRRRRRQVAMEQPTCADFTTDETACLYYKSTCADCSAFQEINGVERTAEELVTEICGADQWAHFLTSDKTDGLLDMITRVDANFSILAIRADTSLPYDGMANGWPQALVTYELMMNVVTQFNLTMTNAINHFQKSTAAPIIAEELYAKIFPATVR